MFINLKDGKKTTYFDRFKDGSQIVYFSTAIKIFPYPLTRVQNIMEQTDKYADMSRYIKKAEVLKEGVSLAVLGIGPARSCFLMNQSSTNHEGVFVLHWTRDQDSVLNYFARKNEKGLFVIEYNEFSVQIVMREYTKGKTKIALVSQVAPKIWVPGWLFSLVSKILYPSILDDFESYIGRSE